MKSIHRTDLRRIFVTVASLMLLERVALAAENWPQFRGPNGSGVAAKASPPVEIGPTNGVLWCAAVPWSPSSPCVWNDRIFLTTYRDHDLKTCCYSRESGKRLWGAGVQPGKVEAFHPTDGSPAAATPATDGKRVVSYFGSFGLICYDINGKELWRHPLPVALSAGNYGSGTSPIIIRNRVILSRDQDQDSSVLAVDLESGKTVWETARPDAVGSFGTPIIWKTKEAEEVVMPGSGRLKGYDLKDGKERWVIEGTTGFACTTPVAGDGLLFFAGWSPGGSDAPWPTWEVFLQGNDKNHDGEITFDEFPEARRDYARGLDRDHDGKITKKDWDMVKERATKTENSLLAIKPGGQGDITKTHVVWKVTRGLPYVPSPLFYEGRIYVVRDGGMMSSFEAQVGKVGCSQERLDAPGSYYSSPVAADGRVYLCSLGGKVSVVKAGGDKPEILHRSDFGERIFATPAIVGPNLYLRTQTKLYAFGPRKVK